MAKDRTPKPDEERLEDLADDIERVRDRETRERREATAKKPRFATPEAYKAAMMEREESESEASLKRAAGEKKDRR